MPQVHDIYAFLQELAPLELQMDYDNSGFQLGSLCAEVTTVLLALDITDAVIEEAFEQGAELIVSHHPLIWESLRCVSEENAPKLMRLIEKHISVISMHTNLDIAEGGVNDVLLRRLGPEPLEPLDGFGCGRIGEYDVPVSMGDFLALCRNRLNTRGLRFYDAGKPVRRLAVMGGSGGSELKTAIAKGCDTYLTADIKYNQFLEAAEYGLNLIDGDHFCTENPIIASLAGRLADAFPQMRVLCSKRHGQVVSFF